MTTPLRALSLRARVLSLNCSLFVALTLARLAQWRRASRPRLRSARSRYAYSGFRRFACLLMIAVMFVQFALFPPEVSHAAVKAVTTTARATGRARISGGIRVDGRRERNGSAMSTCRPSAPLLNGEVGMARARREAAAPLHTWSRHSRKETNE